MPSQGVLNAQFDEIKADEGFACLDLHKLLVGGNTLSTQATTSFFMKLRKLKEALDGTNTPFMYEVIEYRTFFINAQRTAFDKDDLVTQALYTVTMLDIIRSLFDTHNTQNMDANTIRSMYQFCSLFETVISTVKTRAEEDNFQMPQDVLAPVARRFKKIKVLLYQKYDEICPKRK